MSTAVAEIGRPFELAPEIGFFRPEDIIYQFTPDRTSEMLFVSDDFRTRIVLRDPSERYDQRMLVYFYGLSRSIDDGINACCDSYPFVSEKPLEDQTRGIARLHTKEEMLELQEEFIETIIIGRQRLEKKSGRKTVVALPRWGSQAIMRALERVGLSSDILIPANISGSLGTETGYAEVGELDEALTNLENIVMFPDDIFDTCVTLGKLAVIRARQKAEEHRLDNPIILGILRNTDGFEELMREARRGELTPNKTKEVWTDLAQILWETDVIPAPFSIKNQPFFEAVVNLAAKKFIEPDTSDWERQKAASQLQLVAQTHYIHPKNWVIGGKWGEVPLLDTKVKGELIVDELMTDPGNYGLVKEQVDWLVQAGFDRLGVRAFSGLEGLWVFNPDGLEGDDAMNLLVKYYAGHIAEYVKSRC